MRQISDHVYTSDDNVLGCVRNNSNQYVILNIDHPEPHGTYNTLDEAKEAILHYEYLLSQTNARN